jgi:hypothetical protein
MKATLAHANMNVALPPAPLMFQFGDVAFATEALQNAGFRNIASEEIPIVYRGGSPEDVWRWFEQIAVRGMAVYRLQTPEVQRRITDAIIEGARAHVGDGGIAIPCTAMMYTATRPA